MPPPPRCCAIACLEPGAAGGVEADARLVEQPERARARQQAGEVGAALLAGRQEAGRRLGQPARDRSRPAPPRGRTGRRRGPRRRRGSRPRTSSGFSGSAWPTKCRRPRCSTSAAATVLPAQASAPALGRRKPASRRSKRRLAAAVGAAQEQRVAGGELERQRREHQTPAAVAGQLLAAKQGAAQRAIVDDLAVVRAGCPAGPARPRRAAR